MKPTLANYLRPHFWFTCGDERFSVAMDYLQEVMPLPTVRPLPAAEPALAGLVNIRDHVLPVFDPLSLAGITSPLVAASMPIIIVLGCRRRPAMAILAGQVGKVIPLPAVHPLTISARRSDAFAGEALSEDRKRLLVLDFAALSQGMGLSSTQLAADIAEPAAAI